MLYPELEERLQHSSRALERATVESIIERCKRYLELLDEYRDQLFNLPQSSVKRERVDNNRRAVRAAIEHTTEERNRTAALLLSFTAVSAYEATATLNRLRYQGHDAWELRAGGVRWGNNPGKIMTIEMAVETASLLRREEHIALVQAQ